MPSVFRSVVQVGDDLDVAPGVMEVGWVAARWGAVESYLQFDIKSSSRKEGDLIGDFWYGASRVWDRL